MYGWRASAYRNHVFASYFDCVKRSSSSLYYNTVSTILYYYERILRVVVKRFARFGKFLILITSQLFTPADRMILLLIVELTVLP